MSTGSWDKASSSIQHLETYVNILERELKSTEAVLTQLKHKFDQSSEEDETAHEQISSECMYVIKGGAC